MVDMVKVRFTRAYRNYEEGWVGPVPARLARAALSVDAAELLEGDPRRESGDVQTATAGPAEHAARRVDAPYPRGTIADGR